MSKMIYDSRNRVRGRVVATPVKGEPVTHEPRLSAPEVEVLSENVLSARRHAANPANWPRTECDISVAGLGATRRMRRSGLVYLTPAATYRDTPAHERADIRRGGQDIPDNVATEL